MVDKITSPVSQLGLIDKVNEVIEELVVDTVLSTESTNPVQNKVITEALKGKSDSLIAGTDISVEDLIGDKTVNGSSLITLKNVIKDEGLNSVKLFGGAELLPETYIDSVTAEGATELLPETYIDSVTAEGKCIQTNLPEGYTQVNGVTNIGADNVPGYIDTGIVADVDDMEYDVVAKVNSNTTASWYILQSRAYSSAAIYGISGSQNGNTIICGFCGASVQSPSIIRQQDHTYHVNFKCKNGNATLFVEDLTAGTNETTTGTYTFSAATTNTGLFSNIDGSGVLTTQNTSVLSAYIKKSGVKVIDYVSCKDSNNIAGFYDKATSTFKGATAGGLMAESATIPSPSTPMNIVFNNGVIKARMASGLPLGYTKVEYLESSGTQYIDTGVVLKSEATIETVAQLTDTPSSSTVSSIWGFLGNQGSGAVLPRWGCSVYNDRWLMDLNTTTTSIQVDLNKHTFINKAFYNSIQALVYQSTVDGVDIFATSQSIELVEIYLSNTLSAYLFARNNNNTAGNFISTKVFSYKIVQDGVLACNLIPVRRNSDNELGMYDLVSNTFLTNQGTGTFTAGNDDDSVEVYTDDTPETITDNVGNVATCQNLLSIGDYKDTQEILSGAVSRNIGIKILDGTETWNYYSVTQGVLFRISIPDSVSSGKDSLGILCNYFRITGSTGRTSGTLSGSAQNYDFIYDACDTVDKWKKWLADQYNAGNPIVIIYPLATATTETVTGQLLTKSPVTYAGSIPDLTGILVESSHTTPTPTNPLQINCNNGVVKAQHESGLPLGYTKIEYLQSSGTEYINTGKVIKATQTVKCKMALNVIATTTGWMGAIDAANNLLRFGSTNNIIYCQRPTTGSFGIANDTDFHTLIATPTKLYIDNNSDTISVTLDMTTPFALFAQNDGRTSNVSSYLPCKISEFEITEGSTLVQKLIPCKRNSDSVLGMYDTVSNTFLTNAGTGTFTAGSTVTDNVVIYTDGTQETVTDNMGNVATCQNLLSVSDYKDTQEILSGAVTRNVGILVLDGVTTGKKIGAAWNATYKRGSFAVSDMYSSASQDDDALCNQFAYSASVYGQPTSNGFCTHNGTLFISFLGLDNVTSAETANAWLATRYNSGNPIVIVYPLSTATTETVIGQLLQKSPVTYTGSILGLTGTTVTSLHTTPTPTNPLQINCNNGVVKWGVISKNLFDKSKAPQQIYVTDALALRYGYSISVKAGTYTVSGATNNNIYCKDYVGGVYGTALNFYTTSQTFTISQDGYILIYSGVASNFDDQTLIQVEAGSQATSYVQYQEGIYVDGTIETVKVHGVNFFDKTNTSSIGGWYPSSGALATSDSANKTYVMRCKPNTTYYIKHCSVRGGARLFYTEVENWTIGSACSAASGTLVGEVNAVYSIITSANAKWLFVNYGRSSATTATFEEQANDFILSMKELGTGTVYEPYFNGGTATATDLLAVSTYKDVQSVLDGAVTKNIGVKVLDGTENWQFSSTYNCPYIYDAISTLGMVASSSLVCTHNPYVEFSQIANYSDCVSSNTNHIYFKDSAYATDDLLSAFVNWIKAQYQTDHPVMLIYPLATATTETVTAQELTTQTGTNILEVIQASIYDLDLEANYNVSGVEVSFVNDTGYLTTISSSEITTALGYTPVDPSSLATVATTGSYSDLLSTPTIGTANTTIQVNGTAIGTINANATEDTAVDITFSVPTVGTADTTIQVNGTAVGTINANSTTDSAINISLPSIGAANTTIQVNGTAVGTINANATAASAINVSVPTAVSQLATSTQMAAIDSGVNSTIVSQVTVNANEITAINSVIPSAATSSNQLADKSFVNSSISTNTANFIGTFNSVAELEAYTGTVTNNDYAFVISTDTAGNTVYNRYKYNSTTPEWLFEYALNNSSFTSDQWAAINSNVTTVIVSQVTVNANNITSLQTSKQDALTPGSGISISGNTISTTATIDASLSTSSTNAVENRAVTSALNNKITFIDWTVS